MADPITGVTRPWANPLTPAPAPALPSAPPPPPPPATPTATPVRAAIARATGGGNAPSPRLSTTTRGTGSVTRITVPPADDIQQGIDQFVASVTPTYHTPQGDVAVPTCFRMRVIPDDPPSAQAKAEVEAAGRALGLSAAVDPMLVGRATPAQIQAVTQKLIDMGCLSTDPNVPLDIRVRQLMNEHHIGLDCASFVQQAFLGATGLSRGQAHFIAMLNESLSGLSSRHYARVAPSDAQPGDIICLGPPPPPPHPVQPPPSPGVGHRLIVYDAHPATAEDLKTFRGLIDRTVTPTAASSDRVTVLVVYSSFGSGGKALEGGVQQATLFHDEVTDVWGTLKPNVFTNASYMTAIPHQPYAHPLEGIFRWTQP